MANVLVVDDHIDIRLALTTLLEFAGHEVIEADDGAVALQKVVSDMPQVILLDIGMKRVDGFETLMFLKSDKKTRHIPVIMLTSRGRPDERSTSPTIGGTAVGPAGPAAYRCTPSPFFFLPVPHWPGGQ